MKFETRELFAKYTDPETFAKIVEYASVSEMWKHCAAEYADRTAIFDNTLPEGGRAFTYAELDSGAADFRHTLAVNGIKPGDRVGLLSGNSYNLVKALVAVMTYGCTAAVLPAQLDDKSVFGCCMKFSLKALVYAPALEANTVFAAEHIPSLVRIPADAVPGGTEPVRDCAATDPCLIMFTGGTTGRSKGALLSNGAVIQGTVNGCYGYKDVFFQKYMLVLPLSHVFGLIRNLLTPLYTGSGLFICQSPKDLFRDIAVFRPTVLVLVPALAEMALGLSAKFGRNMLGADMKYIICGAAAVNPFLVNEYARLGIALFPGYGLTESANLVSGNPESAAKPDSVGIPYPHQEFRIEAGELWLKGANMMEGYVGDDGENAAAYEDGWFRTGDIVRLDGEGFLYITGRIKETIVLGNGENVYPAEVEAHFNALNIIQDSQVFEDKNENGGSFLALEVVPRMAEIAKLQPENIGEYVIGELRKVNNTLPAYMRVSKITVRDSDFARSPSMKILRYKR